MSARTALSFAEAWSSANPVKGWLEREEAQLLFELARDAVALGRIVELGSFCGRSSIVLAAALTSAGDARLMCVDTFEGSAEHQPGAAYFDPETAANGKVNTFPLFQRNLERAGLSTLVDAARSSSLAAAETMQDPIGMLFVDADHSYAGVRADLDAWEPKVAPRGWIVLHDVGDWSGATRAAADLLDAGYTRHGQQGTALALRKGV
jgi:MMP 1-O-methyltransferase